MEDKQQDKWQALATIKAFDLGKEYVLNNLVNDLVTCLFTLFSACDKRSYSLEHHIVSDTIEPRI